MARDISQTGSGLRRKKVHCLALAYRVFMGGLVATFVADGATALLARL